MSGPDADIKPGNCLPIANIPLGTLIHNVEIKVGKGGQMVRSAGTAAQVMAKGRRLRADPPALRRGAHGGDDRARGPSVGQVGNTDHANVRIGKAGRKRHMGVRPTVPRRRHEPGRPIRTGAAKAVPRSACPRRCPRGARRRRASRPASIASTPTS